MTRNITAAFSKLRAGKLDLLPIVTILLHVSDKSTWSNLVVTLETLARQRFAEFETIVLLDGPFLSPSDVLTLARPVWPSHLPLYVLQSDLPCGKSRCVNLALSRTDSDYLAVLEAGDRPEREWLSLSVDSLDAAPESVIGVYGDLERWQEEGDHANLITSVSGPKTPSRRRLLALLAKQQQIAPPLLVREAAEKVGGYPTDYPGQGWMLADTAFALALLQEGTLLHDKRLHLPRYAPAPSRFERQDERTLARVLVRQAAKRLQLPLPRSLQ
jgi:hypothetical protein